MTNTEAEQILEWLTGCFGKRLEDNERNVWLATLIEMDSTRAMQIALEYGKNGERFPTIPDFRRSVRGIPQPDESWRDQDPEALPIPEFAHVWYWSICTRGDKHRAFPQFSPRPDDAMNDEEYEALRQEWLAAGAPHLKDVRDLLRAVG